MMFFNARASQSTVTTGTVLHTISITTCSVSQWKGFSVEFNDEMQCFSTQPLLNKIDSTTQLNVSQCKASSGKSKDDMHCFSLQRPLDKTDSTKELNVFQYNGFSLKFNHEMHCFSMQWLLNKKPNDKMQCLPMHRLLNEIQWQHALLLNATTSQWSSSQWSSLTQYAMFLNATASQSKSMTACTVSRCDCFRLLIKIQWRCTLFLNASASQRN